MIYLSVNGTRIFVFPAQLILFCDICEIFQKINKELFNILY